MPFIERSYYETGYIADAYYETTIEFIGIILPGFRRSEGDAFLLIAHIKDAAGTPITLRFSYNHPAPVISGILYDPILRSIGNLQKSIMDGSTGIGRRLTSTLGNITLDMESGRNTQLATYQWADRTFELYRGPKYGPTSLQISEFERVYHARFRDISHNDGELTLHIGDSSNRLDIPCENASSSFTGVDLQHGQNAPDLIGKRMPVALGAIFNIQPTLLDHALQIYSIHYRDYTLIAALYDNMTNYAFGGLTENLPGTPPPPGTYYEDRNSGMIRLGSAPTGRLSADVWGDVHSGAFNSGIPRSIYRVVNLFAPDIQIDQDFIESLTNVPAYSGGIYLETGDERTVAQVLDLLCGSVGAYWYIDVGDVMRFEPFQFAIPVGRIEDPDMVSRQADPALPLTWKIEVKYRKNHHVHDLRDLQNPDLTTAARSFALNEWRTTSRSDTTIKDDRGDARTLVIETAIESSLHAFQLAIGLFDLYGVNRKIYRVTVEDQNFVYRIGTSIVLNSVRLAATEKPTIVVQVNELISQRRTELTLWG